jgi:hypothetical protein
MDDDLTLPDFLNRKLNGLATDLPTGTVRRKEPEPRLIWTKKRNWARIAKLERERAKREGTSLKGCTFTNRSGQ